MNGKMMKVVQALVVVVLFSFMTAGAVAADHGQAPVHAHLSEEVRFEQYLAALASQRDAELVVGAVPAALVTRVRFSQYLEALDMERQAALNAEPNSARFVTRDSFSQYLAALEQMERQRAEEYTQLSAQDNTTILYFEQYLQYAR